MDFDRGGEDFISAALKDGASGGGSITIASPASDSDVILPDHASVGRVESAPASVGEVDFSPCVGGFGLDFIFVSSAGMDVSDAVSRGDSEQSCHADKEVREVLADAFSAGEDFEGCGGKGGSSGQVSIVLIDAIVHIGKDL